MNSVTNAMEIEVQIEIWFDGKPRRGRSHFRGNLLPNQKKDFLIPENTKSVTIECWVDKNLEKKTSNTVEDYGIQFDVLYHEKPSTGEPICVEYLPKVSNSWLTERIPDTFRKYWIYFVKTGMELPGYCHDDIDGDTHIDVNIVHPDTD